MGNAEVKMQASNYMNIYFLLPIANRELLSASPFSLLSLPPTLSSQTIPNLTHAQMTSMYCVSNTSIKTIFLISTPSLCLNGRGHAQAPSVESNVPYTEYIAEDGVFCSSDGTAEAIIRFAPAGK